MKKIVSLIMAFVMIATLSVIAPFSAYAETVAEGTCGADLTWTLDDEGTLTVSGTGDMYDWENYTNIPWRNKRAKISSVIIEDGVTSIGKNAFSNCHGLVSITIGNGVTSIGEKAFEGSFNLTDIIIYDKPIIIGERAFYGTAYYNDSLNWENNVLYIGRCLIEAKEDISGEYNIKPGTIKISEGAFSHCKALTAITIPNSVISIGEGAFMACESLTNVIIPDSVTSIEDYVFMSCENLTGITLGNNVTNMGKNTFSFCYSLKSITIPDSVTSIGDETFKYCRDLTDVTLGEGVTSIGNDAFGSCENLAEIIIPDSVITIGDGAFSSCKSLKDITIPEGVTTIGIGAFGQCESLEVITIPDSVTNIGYNAFIWCGKLLRVTIPDGVTEIDDGTFWGCTSLISVKVPQMVTTIGDSAFYDCNRLTAIFYGGSKEEWELIPIGENNEVLSRVTIHCNYDGPLEIEYEEPIKKSGTFNFASGKGLANYDYDDNYFKNSSYSGYNHNLSRMSMKLALSAYAFHQNEGEKYKKQDKNVKALLKELGFWGIKNIGYSEQPTRNSIGVIAANKRIAFEDGDYTLIAVAIRGGNYEAEWGGNFNVGDGDHHAGFALARDQVLTFLTDYVKTTKISGKIKIWITGYSRAGATANLTAAYLNTHSLILNGTNADPTNIIEIKPEDIYAYCMEPPMGVKNPDNKSGIYNNIFNIVNQHDFVPMVAMRKWGFDRYGITKYLPTATTNSDYTNKQKTGLKDTMLTYFKNYQEESYVVDDFTYYYTFASKEDLIKKGYGVQGVYLEKLIDELAQNIGNTSNYKKEFQEVFEYIGENVLGTKKTEELTDSLVKELLSPTRLALYTGAAVYPTLRSGLKAAFENIGIAISNDVVDTLAILIIDVGLDKIITLCENGASLAQGHYPELCMAWLDAIEEKDFRDKRLRTFYLNCPVDLEVYDSNDNLVAAVYDNVPQKIEGSSIVCYIDENGQKVVYLPTDEEYRTEVIATDDGEVTYSIQEYDEKTNKTKVINYNNMAISKDDKLTGTVENLETTEAPTYTLTSTTVEVAEAEVIEEALPLSVKVASEGNGSANGGGEYYKGEFSEVVANALENEEFLGWYNGETLVSSDLSYRFQVTEEITLTAKFTQKTCQILYMTDDEEIVGLERIEKGSKAKSNEIIKDLEYTVLGIYKDKECTVLADENEIYSEDTVLYLKILSEDDVLKGDIFADGKINAKDAVKLAQYLAKWDITLTDSEKLCADVVSDGVINAKDAVKLAQYLAKWDITLE